MHRGSGRDPPGDVVQKGEELRRAVPFDRLPDDLSGGGVEGRQPACRAVPPGVVGSRLGMARRHGQGPLRPPQCLDLRFFVHREDHRVVGRVHIEADDVVDLDREPRITRDLEGFHPVRPEAMAEEDVANRREGHAAHGRGQRPRRPVAGMLRRRRHRQIDQGPHPFLRDRLLPRRAGGVPE